MFEDGVCKFHITMSVADPKAHAQGIDITFPMPDSVIAAPRLQCSGALMLLYMCPHTAIYVSSYCYICVLILLYMCPHTALYVSSCCSICVLLLLYMCPHTAIYVSSCCYICVLMLLYMCPHTALYVSAAAYWYGCICICSGDMSTAVFGL